MSTYYGTIALPQLARLEEQHQLQKMFPTQPWTLAQQQQYRQLLQLPLPLFPLLWKQNQDHNYNIIDGQQRISLMSNLYHYGCQLQLLPPSERQRLSQRQVPVLILPPHTSLAIQQLYHRRYNYGH